MAELHPAPSGYPICLVRDKTPDIINSSGEPGDLFYAKLPQGVDLKPWLERKLLEEVGEYLTAIKHNKSKELMDIMAVVESLAEQHGWMSAEDFLHDSRLDKRGGFTEGVVMYGLHPEFDLDKNEELRK